MAMEAKRLAIRCRELADNRKAEDIVILDVRKVSGVTDYMVICSGTSEPHLRAIEEEIVEELRKEHTLQPHAVDGSRQSGWLVLDFIDVLVHVMKPEQRQRYDLEGLWNDAPRVRVSESAGRKASSEEPAVGEATLAPVKKARKTTPKAARKKKAAAKVPKVAKVRKGTADTDA
jgi:ribosome-associated protein